MCIKFNHRDLKNLIVNSVSGQAKRGSVKACSLSVLEPNLTGESPSKENIDSTITTPSDLKKKLPEDVEKEKKKPRKWTELEIDTLIEMLEERVCLWDVSVEL